MAWAETKRDKQYAKKKISHSPAEVTDGNKEDQIGESNLQSKKRNLNFDIVKE